MKFNLILFLTVFGLLTTACRHDELIFPSQQEEAGSGGGAGGFYVLNEGNMGSNKCTLDYYDFSSGVYNRNIYPERNPQEVMELGDVGNDMAVYGSKLYIVVNCSHKVEVLDALTATKIAQIEIPNCRYLAFDGGNAYVSSYIGPVGVDPSSPLGAVFRVDTATLKITGEIAVGYQPEEMAVADGTLFVANSGGYRPPQYDNTITAIDLATFTPSYTITGRPNMHRLKADRYGRLWASSRGNYSGEGQALLMLEKGYNGLYEVSRTFDLSCENFTFRGDELLYFGKDGGNYRYGSIDITTFARKGAFISPALQSAIIRPYALAVDPSSEDVFITDAKNYVSSGTIYCVGRDGNEKWSARTGDIPSAIAFTDGSLAPGVTSPPSDAGYGGAYIAKVFEYRPAPGQFVNVLPFYFPGDTEEDMIRKCEESICGTSDVCISLGGFGGYVTFGFDHLVRNVEGEADFRLWGNAIWQSADLRGGSAEPGIIMVSYDANGNGLPDDEWFEIAGSEYDSPLTAKNYTITYTDGPEIGWKDSLGSIGIMTRNPYHTQSYWPQWINTSELTFSGNRLAPNAKDLGGTGSNYVLFSYDSGYADNYPNTFAAENSFDISRAVDSAGNPANLPGIHFIRVYTAVNQQCGPLGETSTEISKAQDLHY